MSLSVHVADEGRNEDYEDESEDEPENVAKYRFGKPDRVLSESGNGNYQCNESK